MATNDYYFTTHWCVQGTLQEVAEIIGDAESLPRWWPSVYLEVRVLEEGDAAGVGKRVSLVTKGWLPYTLRWQFRVSESAHDGFTLLAEGDFVGRGIWTLAQEGEWVTMTYDWQIEATKPLLKYLSFLLKPIFSMNHLWAMERGEESLILELRRRRPLAENEDPIPAPPPPTPSDPLRWLVYVISRRSPVSRA
jgi:hypothetical protein